MVALADLAESLGGDIRLTRQQNFVLTNVAPERLAEVTARLAEIGLPLDAGTLRGDAVACTGEPHCNFSVTETKSRMDGLVQLLEERFGKDADGLRLNLDGCPHACAHHWVGEIGFQGTTVRDEEGKRRQAYDVYLRGSLDRPAAIGAPGVQARADRGARRRRRRPRRRLGRRSAARARRFRQFADRTTDEDLGRLAGREPARPGRRRRQSHERSIVLDDLEAGELAVEFEGEEPEVVIEWAIERFSPSLSISTAFQTDGAVLLHMAYQIDPNIRMFSVDTGRLPERDVRAGRADVRALPEAAARPALADAPHRSTRWSRSTARTSSTRASRTGCSAARCARCCRCSSISPGSTRGSPACAATSGRRAATSARSRSTTTTARSSSSTRSPSGRRKTCWDYVREHELPYNSLYDKGYTSIGCAPCTRPTQKGEDLRAGRWWWETGAPKECGIHCAIETGGLEHELRALIGDGSD